MVVADGVVDHAPWELVPFPQLTHEQLESILEKHDLGHLQVALIPPTGVINATYSLGDEFILRVPKDVHQGHVSVTTESIVAPVAWRSGVKTPALVVYDDDRDIVSTPFTIYERIDGKDLMTLGGDFTDYGDVYRSLGADLALLHRNVVECPNDERLVTPTRVDPFPVLCQLVRDGFIGRHTEQWLTRCFQRLQPAIEESASYRRFLHNDATPTNILATGGQYAAVIDWGDAGWGDPALEFRQFPFRVVWHALEGYRSVMPLDGDDSAEARIFYDHFSWALLRFTERRGLQPCDWEAPIANRLMELVAWAFTKSPWGTWDAV